jgi:arylsulfatase
MRDRQSACSLIVFLVALTIMPSLAGQEVLPKPEQPFQGKIGRTVKDSTPDFPKGVEAPRALRIFS